MARIKFKFFLRVLSKNNFFGFYITEINPKFSEILIKKIKPNF